MPGREGPTLVSGGTDGGQRQVADVRAAEDVLDSINRAVVGDLVRARFQSLADLQGEAEARRGSWVRGTASQAPVSGSAWGRPDTVDHPG